MIQNRILLVEDDTSLIDGLEYTLVKNGFNVRVAQTVQEALLLFEKDSFDLLLLDLTLPDGTGFDICRSVRRHSEVPIIFLTASDEEVNVVMGLDIGGDDYITKPFGTSELLARIRTAMRHQQVTVDVPERTIFSVGDLTIDFDKRLVTLNNNPVHFTPIEYKILEILTQYPGKVVTYDQIIKDIWGPYTNENQTLRVNMANIRRKIEKNPAEPKYILTEVGVGYRFVDEI